MGMMESYRANSSWNTSRFSLMPKHHQNMESEEKSRPKPAWKHVREQKKKVKKMLKEEEFLENLRKPKDTKVVLADKSLIEKLRNQTGPARPNRSPVFLAQDFPALSPSVSLPRSSSTSKEQMAYNKVVNRSISNSFFPPIETTTEKNNLPPKEQENSSDGLSTAGDEIQTGNIHSADVVVDVAGMRQNHDRATPGTPQKAKGVKKKDPVVLNINDLLTKEKSKKDKERVAYRRQYQRVAEVGVFSGNMLDSSNPKRKRGKHRSIKKLKLSKLKLAIIRDRILKLKARENATVEDLTDSKQLKIEVDQYLSNLMKKKLEVAEKRKLAEETNTEELTPTETLPKGEEVILKKKPKYRKYCDNSYSEALDKSVSYLITRLVYLQNRAFNKNPVNAKVKRRHVVGLREVKKYLMLKKIKMIVVPPDLEASDAICNIVEDLKKAATLQNVPCFFALSRRTLGYLARKPVPVSAFGIMNHDGLEDQVDEVKEKLKEAQLKQASTKCENENTANDTSATKEYDES